MLVLVRPDLAERSRIQQTERWIYWSGLAEVILRKHGFIFTEARNKDQDDFIVATRGATVSFGADLPAGIYEGPIDLEVLARLGIGARLLAAECVEIEILKEKWTSNGVANHDGLRYSRDIVRRIPAARGERSDPFVLVPGDFLLDVRRVPVQIFDPPLGWEVIARAKIAGTTGDLPVCITDRRVTLIGLPLFDILVRKHWMPPTSVGYYTLESSPITRLADWWLAHLIRTAATAAQCQYLMIDHWPNGQRAALSVRLDHDRSITSASLAELLDYFDDKGLKASWGFLARLAPPDALNAVAERGHEIVLHSETGEADRLQREVAYFRDQGFRFRGVTVHGGIGSAGHFGQTFFDQGQQVGFDHADAVSRDTIFPYPTLAASDKGVTTRKLFAPSVHHSLDLGTAPHAHQLATLSKILPELINDSEHVTLMNHPDVHRSELKLLLDSIVGPGIWYATHAQVIDWTRAVKFGWYLDSSATGPMVHFPPQSIGAIRVRRFCRGNIEREFPTCVAEPA